MGVYRKHKKGIYSGRDESKWIEELMHNYYCLYKLEKEELMLPILDINCAGMFLSNIKIFNVKKAIKLLNRHMHTVPLKHSLHCAKQIISLSIGSVIKNTNQVLSRKKRFESGYVL